jgi:hypothetical protein
MTDSPSNCGSSIASAEWCCEAHAIETDAVDESVRQSRDTERRGRLAAEERLARIRLATNEETWSTAIARWRVATFGLGPLERSFERALEEFDEMIDELGCSGPDGTLQPPYKFRPDVDKKKVAKEAADFVIALSAFVADLGYDLATEVSEKHRINSTERQWFSKGDGTGYHIKPGADYSNTMPRNPDINKVLEAWEAQVKAGLQVPVEVVPQALIDAEAQFEPETKKSIVLNVTEIVDQTAEFESTDLEP